MAQVEQVLTSPLRDKVVSAEEAIRLVGDGDSIAVDGFMGQAYAEALVLELERRFLATGSPRGLSAVFPVAVGDKAGRGLDHLAHPGLLERVLAGHWGMCPALQRLAVEGRIEAHNLPQGVISQLFRDTAAGRPGLLTRVGLGTFVDPRNGGGKVNDRTTRDLVQLVHIDGEELLFYRSLDVDVALLRGTTGDPDGNITMEREALTLEARAMATAVHNSGGLVCVQVERVAERGTLDPRQVVIPGVLVDCVVVAEPAQHTQTMGTAYSPAFSGEVRVPLTAREPLPTGPRKVVARRAAMELRPGMVVNLGIGMPEGVAAVAQEEGVLRHLTLTAEPGVIGGLPQAGLDFGSSVNAAAVLDQPAQFDFYDGGGLDAAFLGMAEVDRHGNVNVSRFGSRLAGAGGFINISQSARQLVFLGSFATPVRCRVEGATLVPEPGTLGCKVVDQVEQVTFSGGLAAELGRSVLYVTERCVFRLGEHGLVLTEVAPGLDVERDVLAHLPFAPVVDDEPVQMDARVLAEVPMRLDRDWFDVPWSTRFSYDASRNLGFLDLGGLDLRTEQDVDDVAAAVERALAPVGRRIDMVVTYDNFSVDHDVHERYLAAVQRVEERHYASVTRYSASAFLRLRLAAGLEQRGLTAQVRRRPG